MIIIRLPPRKKVIAYAVTFFRGGELRSRYPLPNPSPRERGCRQKPAGRLMAPSSLRSSIYFSMS